MKTLDEHNADRYEELSHRQDALNNPSRNGIACPKCGDELYDSNPGTLLASDPPKKNVHCDCGYRGYQVA